MIKKVKCPVCMGKNCLPIEPTFGTNGVEIKVEKCENCGVELTSKEYMNKLKSTEHESK